MMSVTRFAAAAALICLTSATARAGGGHVTFVPVDELGWTSGSLLSGGGVSIIANASSLASTVVVDPLGISVGDSVFHSGDRIKIFFDHPVFEAVIEFPFVNDADTDMKKEVRFQAWDENNNSFGSFDVLMQAGATDSVDLGDVFGSVHISTLEIEATDDEFVVGTMTWNDHSFVPGEDLTAPTDDASDRDYYAVFYAIEGTKVTLTIHEVLDGPKLTFTFWDPTSEAAQNDDLLPPFDTSKLTFTATTTGFHRLQVSSASAAATPLAFTSRRKVPKSSKSVFLKTAMPEFGGPAFASFVAPGAATMSGKIKTNAAFDGPLSLTFKAPSGAEIDLLSFVTNSSGGKLTVKGVPLDEGGEYELFVDGFGADPLARAFFDFDLKVGKAVEGSSALR